ncbi:hypothetical protein [Clostridium sp. SGI.024]|uniref:hypothetical protein n=1 Tax=Clostridium sp. SGI.024 TaxID=3420551 RepID=UPI003D082D9B
MEVNFKNTVNDMETLMRYRFSKIIWSKIFYFIMRCAIILIPIVTMVDYFIENKKPLLIVSILLILLIGLLFTMVAIYIVFKFLPKLIQKRIKKISQRYFKVDKFFSVNKKIIVNDRGISIIYGDEKKEFIFKNNNKIDEFEGCILITEVNKLNKNVKVYPIVIPTSVFKDNIEKKEFILRIKSAIQNKSI